MSPLFISSVKLIFSDSGEKSALIMHCIQAKTNMLMDFAMREQQRMEFLFFKQSVYWDVTICNSNTTVL